MVKWLKMLSSAWRSSLGIFKIKGRGKMYMGAQ